MDGKRFESTAMTTIVALRLLLLSALSAKLGSTNGPCLTNLMTRQSISQTAVYLGRLTEVDSRHQWLFPQLKVTCSTTITRIRFVGEELDWGDENPELQIWRKQSPTSSRYSKIHHTNRANVVSMERLHLYATAVSWQVQAGDVFGVYQPNVRRSRYNFGMQERGSGQTSYVLTNQRQAPRVFDISRYDENGHQYPLVNVVAGDSECASGFLDLLGIIKKASVKSGILLNNLSTNENQVRIIPAVSFACNGTITKALFAAVTEEETSASTTHPELQLWQTFSSLPWFYNRRSRASLEGAMATDELNVYEKSFPQPMRFETGDVLGLYLPQEEFSPLKLYFLVSGIHAASVPSYSIERGNLFTSFNANSPSAERDHDIPLLNIEIVVECGEPAPPANGRVSVSSTTAGSLATYHCDEGHRLVGNRQRTCSASNGEWTDSTPACHMVDCGAAPVPINGQVTYNNPSQPEAYNSVVTYSCDVGFELGGMATRQCTDSGEWSGNVPTCTLIKCGQPDVPQNGVVNTTPDMGLNASAIYNCSEGYTLVGQTIRICRSNKTWDGSAPECIPDCAPLPPRITNGEVTFPPTGSGAEVHSIVEYSCNRGSRLVGNRTLTCMENSQWSSAPPVCTAVDCGPLENPSNGFINMDNGTEHGARASYRCAGEKFLLEGNHFRVCQENGKWSGTTPKCILQESSPTPPSIEDQVTELESTTAKSESTESRATTTDLDIDYTSEEYPILKSSQSLTTVVVMAILSVVTVSMIAVIVGLCARQRRHQKRQIVDRNMAESAADFQENSIDNPMYGGGCHFSFNYWDPHTTPAPPSPFADDSTLYSNPAYFECEYPEAANSYQTMSSVHTGNRPRLYYDIASVVNPAAHYEVMDTENHYEMASNLELPALPYETPTPINKYPPTTIYGSLPWGYYVPTEEQRSRTCSSILPTSSTPVSLKSHASLASMFFEECDIYWKPASDSASLYEQLARNKYREIGRHQIQITENLGSGQFGQVSKGVWQSPVGVVPVAVKTLKERKEQDVDEVRFLQEAAINGQFHHRNVVKLLGVVTLGKPVMIVLEFCPNGDLRGYLLQARPSPGNIMDVKWPRILLKFCEDIACGMEYLSKKAFVHRDLAARNILLSEDKTCKISDFGLSRDLEDENYYISHGGEIPVKWTAPEALHYKKYSTASDVWSFGCVMYEIWSLGHKPFEKYPNMEVMRIIDSGFRLAPPPGCIEPIYRLMIQCWHPVSSLRPSFSTVLKRLKEVDFPQSSETHAHLTGGERSKGILSHLLLLGAPLDLGKNLYPELQLTYITDDSEN